jgi:hypothetical protein
MTYNFGDSFDLYATTSDPANNYWDSVTTPASASIVAGRFSAGRAFYFGGGVALNKTSNINDPVHHFTFSGQNTVGISGTATWAITLYDGATAQCSVVFREDGTVFFTSGLPAGTVLATVPNLIGITQINTWFGFEVEVVISNTAGSFAIRRNGNSVNDFIATGLNTRNSTNNYANKIQLIAAGAAFFQLDDFYWQSGATPGNWLGELRCLTRMPASEQSLQFSPSGARNFSTGGGSGNVAQVNRAWYSFFTPTASGQLVSTTVTMLGTYTGNMKCAAFADNGSGSPGAVLASATNIINNPVGTVTFTFSPSISVTGGQKIWIGLCVDSSSGGSCIGTGSGAAWISLSGPPIYAAFPVANPTSLSATGNVNSSINISGNAILVNEAQQDGVTTYVYDSNPGDADFYGLPPTPIATPFSTVAVISRGYMQKSDAGTRTAAMQTKSGSAIAAAPTMVLTNTGWQWNSRHDMTDPNTGAAWAAAAVDALQIGPKVIA